VRCVESAELVAQPGPWSLSGNGQPPCGTQSEYIPVVGNVKRCASVTTPVHGRMCPIIVYMINNSCHTTLGACDSSQHTTK